MNKKKNILVLNNSYSESQLIRVLRTKNNVFTCGFIDPFTKIGIKHFKINYTNYKYINSIIKKYKITNVFPSANDLTLLTLAKLKFKNKLCDNLKIINILHNKYLFRKYYKKIKFFILKSNIAKKNFPLLIKPQISSTGRGLVKINNRKELQEMCNKLSKKNFFIEKFVNGTDHGMFNLIQNKKIVFTFFDTEQRYINPYAVSSTFNSDTIPHHKKIEILNEINVIINDLNLCDGILHLQLKYNKKHNQIYIIEITRRIPGDMYLKFIEQSTNYAVIKNLIKIYQKQKVSNFCKIKNNYILRKILFASKNGYFKKLYLDNRIKKNIIYKKIFIKKNQIIDDYFYKRIGIIMLKFKSKSEMISAIKTIDKSINIELKL